jgi:hypothetical protein
MLIATPFFWRFDTLNHQAPFRSRANGGGRNCVPNKDRADFPSVCEFDHTLAFERGLSAQRRACRVPQGCGSSGATTTRPSRAQQRASCISGVASPLFGVALRAQPSNAAIAVHPVINIGFAFKSRDFPGLGARILSGNMPVVF